MKEHKDGAMMRRTITVTGSLVVIAAVTWASGARTGAQGQAPAAPLVTQGQAGTDGKMYRVGGGVRDGASAFPRVRYEQMKPLVPGQVDFKTFPTYEEPTEFFGKRRREYPTHVNLYSFGKSWGGRGF